MSSRRAALLSLAVLTLGGLVSGPVVAEIKKPVVALLPGVVDPFYFTMYRGAQQAAKEEGVELVFQIPKAWNTAEQVPMTLTARQRQVLQMIAQGFRMREIAGTLQLSRRTVETHKYEIMRVLGSRTTAELVRYATWLGLIET